MPELSEVYADGLRRNQRAIARVERELFDRVVRIRREGYSYAEIGKALGVTRQAAWERFHVYVDEQLGPADATPIRVADEGPEETREEA